MSGIDAPKTASVAIRSRRMIFMLGSLIVGLKNKSIA
jgi:hypothetical protein